MNLNDDFADENVDESSIEKTKIFNDTMTTPTGETENYRVLRAN